MITALEYGKCQVHRQSGNSCSQQAKSGKHSTTPIHSFLEPEGFRLFPLKTKTAQTTEKLPYPPS